MGSSVKPKTSHDCRPALPEQFDSSQVQPTTTEQTSHVCRTHRTSLKLEALLCAG